MRVVRTLEDDHWLEVAAGSDTATFFHTPHWRTLILRTYPEYVDATMGAEIDGRIGAVLPLLETSRSGKGFHRHLLSTFGGCYGGLITSTSVPPDRQLQIYQALLGQRVGSLEMIQSPLARDDRMPDGFTARPYSTHMLSLAKGWEAVRRGFSRGNRSSINRGRRSGVSCRIASDLDSFRDYHDVYESSLRRWGKRATSRYPWRLFEVGQELGRSLPDNMRLWLAEADGKVVAGAWVFYWNRHAVYWHGATDEASSSHRPSNVLHAHIIEDACARGYLWYDFNPSGGHEGVIRFKRSFGSIERPISVWRYQSTSAEMLSSVKRLLR